MSSLCPFAKDGTSAGGVCPIKPGKNGADHSAGGDEGAEDPRVVPTKCPFDYDSNTFKLRPLSCIVCQVLLHDTSKACISRFKDCLLCGADGEGIEPDA